MISFTAAQEALMLLVWIKFPIAEDYVPSQSRRNRRKIFPKYKSDTLTKYARKVVSASKQWDITKSTRLSHLPTVIVDHGIGLMLF